MFLAWMRVIPCWHLHVLSAFLLLPHHVCMAANILWPRTTYPSPIAIAPSQNWDGNDGPWSSFVVQIGTPAQTVKVLVGTAATQTWAIAMEGCVASDPTNCGAQRGGLYNYNLSTTWVRNLANISTDIYYLDLESNLGYTGNGRYGFDDITLGWQGSGGPSLKNQTVAGVAAKDFFMGIFGLTPRPNNFTTFDDPIPSYMENLRNQSLIPSLSWAYTAGNQYRLNSVLGSLTLGGYDTSRFVSNNLTITFSAEDVRDLTVEINNIVTGSGTSLLPSPIPAFLDSTVPYIWLPVSACALFEEAFGLTWNETSELYILNDTQHATLKSQNASIKFTLGSLTSSTTVDITFPYSAFDLTASYPLTDIGETAHYFPLKRAANATQYTLGRTFFQEAYVIADYDRKNFSVSQCKWDAGSQQNIVAILPPSNDTSNSNSNGTSNSTPSPSLGETAGFPTSAIVGIATGGGVIVLALAIFLYIKRKRKRKGTVELEASSSSYKDTRRTELDGATTVVPEMESGKAVLVVEMASEGIHRVELPAREEVAAEMTGSSLPAELDAYQIRDNYDIRRNMI